MEISIIEKKMERGEGDIEIEMMERLLELEKKKKKVKKRRFKRVNELLG